MWMFSSTQTSIISACNASQKNVLGESFVVLISNDTHNTSRIYIYIGITQTTVIPVSSHRGDHVNISKVNHGRRVKYFSIAKIMGLWCIWKSILMFMCDFAPPQNVYIRVVYGRSNVSVEQNCTIIQ